jgi:hypothetical protein
MKVVTVIQQNDYPKIAIEKEGKARRTVRQFANRLKGNIQKSMQGPKSGRRYGAHQASAPGEAPAIDLSNYVNSIHVEMMNPDMAAVFSNTNYGPMLEFGTRRMAARPHWTPESEKIRQEFIEAMRRL